MKRKSNQSVTSPSATVQRFRAFGPPQLLEGEDAAAYDEFLGRICAAVKPLDVIDDISVFNAISYLWDSLRYRRLKAKLMAECLHEALEAFLIEVLDYSHYRGILEKILDQILEEEKIPEDQAQDLARRYARSEPDSVKKVDAVLKTARVQVHVVEKTARGERAKELAQEFAQRKPAAIKQVSKFLASKGRTMDDLLANAITGRIGHNEEIDYLTAIERIERLITIADTCRDAALREIERRRVTLAEALRRKVAEVDGEFEVIDKVPAEAKNAA